MRNAIIEVSWSNIGGLRWPTEKREVLKTLLGYAWFCHGMILNGIDEIRHHGGRFVNEGPRSSLPRTVRLGIAVKGVWPERRGRPQGSTEAAGPMTNSVWPRVRSSLPGA